MSSWIVYLSRLRYEGQEWIKVGVATDPEARTRKVCNYGNGTRGELLFEWHGYEYAEGLKIESEILNMMELEGLRLAPLPKEVMKEGNAECVRVEALPLIVKRMDTGSWI